MKKLNMELAVGLFMVLGFLAFVYLSLQLGEFSIFSMAKQYTVKAEFTNVSGLKEGAEVEIAGVKVGDVATIRLTKDDLAQVTMLIDQKVAITTDAIASVRTQGIIGDKFIRILEGGADKTLKDGGVIQDTEPAIDLEELVSKYVFQK
jgi:phospholipid/cholesterol/gamma-HCH transport system substrate-binding protein